MMFWASALLFVAGMVSAAVFSKSPRLVRLAGFFFPLIACLALLASGVLVLLGTPLSPIVLASATPFGSISYGLDALSGFFAILIGFIGLSVSLYSFSYVKEYEHKGYSIPKFVFLFNLFLLSMAMVASAQNALAFLVFWELMAVSSYFLVSFESKETTSKDAGLVYLLMTHFGSACLIVMFLILSGGAGGSMDFSAFAHGQYAGLLKDAIFVLALVGFGMKAGLMPFHIWLPIAHPAAPSNVSALMSGVMLKTAIYGMVRVFFGFLLVGSVPAPLWWGFGLLALGALSSVMGVFYSLMEHDLKVLLAYHSIENIGIILTGLGAAVLFSSVGLPTFAALALFAALFHTLNHALFKSLLFSGAGAVLQATHTRNIDDLGGLAKKMPYTALLFFIGAASIAALPPFNGFVSEWLTFSSLLGGLGDSKTVAFAAAAAMLALALTSAFAVAAFVKAFGVPFLGAPRSKHAQHVTEVGAPMLAGMALMGAACVLAGLFPGVLASLLSPVLIQFNYSPIALAGPVASLPTLGIFIALVAISAALYLIIKLLQKSLIQSTVSGPTWDCGYQEYTGRMQYSAKGFTMPIIRAFDFLASPLGKFGDFGSRLFYSLIYTPISNGFLWLSPFSRKLHTGRLTDYLLYLLVTLAAVITFAILG